MPRSGIEPEAPLSHSYSMPRFLLQSLAFALLAALASARTLTQQQQQATSTTTSKPQLIISTDADIDDLLAIAAIVHSDVYDLAAIIVNGNAWTDPIGGVPNVLTILDVSEGSNTGTAE